MIHTIQYRYQINEFNSFASFIKSMQEKDSNNKMTFGKKRYFSKKHNRTMVSAHECDIRSGMFKIKITRNTMRIQVNLSKLLYGDDTHYILPDDLPIIKEKYNNFIEYFLSKVEKSTGKLIRVDFKKDFKLTKAQKDHIYSLIERKVKNLKSYFDNATGELQSFKIKSEYTCWNIYDRYAKSKDKLWESIYRIELQVYTKKHLKAWGLSQELDNYLNENTFNLIFLEALEKLLGSGNWYKNNLISKLLNGKKNKEFLLHSLQQLQFDKSLKINAVFTKSQLKQLKEKNINPLQGNINLKLDDVQVVQVKDIDNSKLVFDILEMEYCVKFVHKKNSNEIIFSGYRWGDIKTFGVYSFNINELLVKKAG